MSRRTTLRYVLVLTLVLAMLISHGVMLYNARSQPPFSLATLAAGVIVLALLKHLGLLSGLVALLRRRFFR